MTKRIAYIGRYPIENSEMTLIEITSASEGTYRFLAPVDKGLKDALIYAEKELKCTHWTPRYGRADPRTQKQRAADWYHADQPKIMIHADRYDTDKEQE